MDKSEAIEIFGSQAAIARACGVSRQAVFRWPDKFDQRMTDELVGAALRLNIMSIDEARYFLTRKIRAA